MMRKKTPANSMAIIRLGKLCSLCAHFLNCDMDVKLSLKIIGFRQPKINRGLTQSREKLASPCPTLQYPVIWSSQFPLDLLPDDRQSVLPELARAEVNAEAGGRIGSNELSGSVDVMWADSDACARQLLPCIRLRHVCASYLRCSM
jgi:hypothetical protein